MIPFLELAVALAVIAAIYAWERQRVRRIHAEGDANRRETRAIFRDLRRRVEEAHERKK